MGGGGQDKECEYKKWWGKARNVNIKIEGRGKAGKVNIT